MSAQAEPCSNCQARPQIYKTLRLCYRCYQYQLRNNGELPPAETLRGGPNVQISLAMPKELQARVIDHITELLSRGIKVKSLTNWINRAIVRCLDERME